MQIKAAQLMLRMLLTVGLCGLYATTLLPGCSGEDPMEPGPGPGPAETVAASARPTGSARADVGETIMYTALGAASSLGHELEYQFDSDADGAGVLTSWSDSETASISWSSAAVYTLKARARCKRHPSVVSAWSEGLTVEVGQGAATELFKITTTYMVGGQTFVDSIDFEDATPDTVPFGSWLTLYYRGGGGANGLMRYQLRYERESARTPLSFAEIPWVPPTPENSNGGAPWDSSSMNMGSVEYDIFVRAVDFFNRPDQTPEQVSIVGNFDPILDGFELIEQDGGLLTDNDTLEFDWWAPADSGFTGNLDARFKTFFFVIKASGHDHAMDPDSSGVKAWFYDFENVADPSQTEPFARAGGWFDGEVVDALCDTAWIRFEYPIPDINGDEVFINDPPRWQNETIDFTIRGRDTRALERFQQSVVYAQQVNLMNDYFSGRFGRWTPQGQQRMHMRIVR